jgi:DNA-directed RNA polymerase subunit RPC12/RpoP
MTCSCGAKMERVDQAQNVIFAQKFTWYKCPRCGKTVREVVNGAVNGLDKQKDQRSQSSN